MLRVHFRSPQLESPIEFKVKYYGSHEDKPCPISIGCHFCDGPGNIVETKLVIEGRLLIWLIRLYTCTFPFKIRFTCPKHDIETISKLQRSCQRWFICVNVRVFMACFWLNSCSICELYTTKEWESSGYQEKCDRERVILCNQITCVGRTTDISILT